MTTLWVLWVAYSFALLIDLLYVQPYRRRRAAEQGERHSAGAISFGLRAALPVFTLVLLLRTFVIDVYHIPSQSMMPTLEEGARIWVNRLAYGLRSPVSGTRLLGEEPPQRGDMIVFQYPREPRTTYVKRLLGLPGDHIRIAGDQIFLNDRPLLADDPDEQATLQVVLGDSHFRLYDDPDVESDLEFELVVPPRHYFAIGDNLNHSDDSRTWGPLAAHYILGRVIE